MALVFVLFLTFVATTGAFYQPLDPTPEVWLYLPAVHLDPTNTPTPAPTPYACPATSEHQYQQGFALQYDRDDPVRPAVDHADKNLALRSYVLNTDANLLRELVDYGSDDPTQPPQFATLFMPYRVPDLTSLQQVHDWYWAPSPAPGIRGAPITRPKVTALGLKTAPGDILRVPVSGYDLGDGVEVVVLFADEDTIALRYTREDSSGAPGYTLHVDHICTDPNLLALYNQLDLSDGPRYIVPYPRYALPALPAGQPFGTARGSEIILAIVDTGAFQDPRSCNEWWQIRPGHSAACLAHE